MRARTLPKSKAAQEILGPKEKKRESLAPSSLKVGAKYPPPRVRVTLGKRSPPATPRRAVAPASLRSATRTSGRRRSNSSGVPTALISGSAGGGAGGAGGAFS